MRLIYYSLVFLTLSCCCSSCQTEGYRFESPDKSFTISFPKKPSQRPSMNMMLGVETAIFNTYELDIKNGLYILSYAKLSEKKLTSLSNDTNNAISGVNAYFQSSGISLISTKRVSVKNLYTGIEAIGKIPLTNGKVDVRFRYLYSKDKIFQLFIGIENANISDDQKKSFFESLQLK